MRRERLAARATAPTISARLGLHHFAHLRAVAQGLPLVESAKRYLGVEHAAAATNAHRLVVDQVRAVARRNGDSRWRLIGLELPAEQLSAQNIIAVQPTLQSWAESQGFGDWSEQELQQMYDEQFAETDATAPSVRRRWQRVERLRKRRLALLDELSNQAAERPAPLDLLDGWLSPALASSLRNLGLLTLADLQTLIQRGGRWWSGLRGFGPLKAQRLAAFVEMLLPSSNTLMWPVALAKSELIRLSGRTGVNRVTDPGAASIAAQDDHEAMKAWIAAKAGSPHTAAQYQREVERFLLWCVLEQHKALSDVVADDCRAYMDFLADVPARWISRRRAQRMEPGWAPFKGPLSLASQRVAIDVLGSFFAWLVKARYLIADPWALVNRRLGDDPDAADELDGSSRAFTPAAWAALIAQLDRDAPGPATARMRWLLTFMKNTGLRAAELIGARRGDLREEPEGWLIRVHGKGRRNRTVPVPRVAIEATRTYFAQRQLAFDAASADVALLVQLEDQTKPMQYRPLADTLKRFVKRAIRQSALSLAEKQRAQRASLHWLRHTYATRAAEGAMPLDVLQENLGQADPRTTGIYYRAQRKRRQLEVERIFATEL